MAYVSIGPTPAEEECAQVGDENYESKAIAECIRFIELLRKKFGPEPDGARLSSKSFSHDYGSYREVVCYYNDSKPDSVEYAFKCENEAPGTWAE